MSKDIASGRTVLGTSTPVQLFAGEAPIITGDYVLKTAVVKYQACTVEADGTVSALTAAADNKGLVIASQAGVIGDSIAFFEGGYFNHEALVWPADATTLVQRRELAGVGGTIKIGRLVN